MARNARGRGYARISSRALEFFTQPQQHLAVRFVGLLIRLRAELTVITVTLFAQLLLVKAGMSGRWALVTLLVIIGTLLAVPATSRYIKARCWAVNSRHRARACLVQTRTMTHAGKLPYLLWSRPSPVGERIRVWLPAGLCVKDIEDVADELGAACWGHSARVYGKTEQAALVFIEIIRRDPLTGDKTLRPHVVDTLPEPVTSDGQVIALPLREDITTADQDSMTEPTPIRRGQVHQANRPNNTRRTPNGNTSRDATNKEIETHQNTPTVVGLNGEDLSDYV